MIYRRLSSSAHHRHSTYHQQPRPLRALSWHKYPSTNWMRMNGLRMENDSNKLFAYRMPTRLDCQDSDRIQILISQKEKERKVLTCAPVKFINGIVIFLGINYLRLGYFHGGASWLRCCLTTFCESWVSNLNIATIYVHASSNFTKVFVRPP